MTRTLLLLAASLALPCGTARAGITSFDAFKNVFYTQTSDAQPLVPTSAFFAARVIYNTPGDVGGASATYSGINSPLIYAAPPPGVLAFQYTKSYPGPAPMDAEFPDGTTFNVQVAGGTLGTQSATLTLPSTPIFPAIPFLTGNTYSRLQGLNASTANLLTINGFAAVPGANFSALFAQITRVSDGVAVFNASFLSNTTTSLSLAANTLAAGTEYQIELINDSRFNTPNAGFNGATGVAGYDRRTTARFTTAAAVPEPSSLALMAIGAASIGLVARHRRPGSPR